MKVFTPLEKIAEARMLLVRELPFFASIFFRLGVIEDLTCRTAWTDGVQLGYNTNWLGQWDIPEILGVFVHEILHVILKHHLREELNPVMVQHHDKFNRAADYALNPIVVKTPGCKLPVGCLLDLEKWPDELAEIIFQQLPDHDPNCPSCNGSGKTGAGKPCPCDGSSMGEVRPFKDGKASAAEKDAKANEVDQWVNAAAMKSQNAGRYGAQEERLVKQMKAPEADWLSLLQFVVQDVCRDDYTWHRPNNRYVQAGVFLPSMNGHRRVDMMFFVDTSGSLSNDQLARIMANVREIISSFNVRVIMVYWDTEYRGTEVFYPDDILEPTWKLNYKGGGGTDFDDVVDWMVDSIDEYDFDPKAVVFFTDTETDRWPDEDPNLPWVWAQVPGYNNHFTSNYYKYMPEWGEHVRVPVFSGESS